MPVEFLTDEQAAGYAAFRGAPARAELERFFFLDDADRELVESKRRSHNRLGFAAQLTTVRFLGVFLDAPTDVPVEVADYLAEQLGIEDSSVLAAYGERENTRLDHVRELRRLLEYREFAEAEPELRAWVDARAWTTGEGPKALFDAAVGWLRERRVLLPGVTTLTRLVAGVREAANQRLWETLHGLLTPGQRAVLDELLTVSAGARVSELDRLRRGAGAGVGAADEGRAGAGPGDRPAGDGRGGRGRSAAALAGGAVPVRRGREGVAAAAARRRAAPGDAAGHRGAPDDPGVDDALDLLDVLVATRLLARAERETAKEKLKTLPKVERAGAKLAAALQVVLEETAEQVDTSTGEITAPKVATLAAMWRRSRRWCRARSSLRRSRRWSNWRRRWTPTPTRRGGGCWSAGSPRCGRS